MKEIIEFLNKSDVQYMATTGLDGKPKVRPFQFMFEEDEKLWFCSSNQKEIYKELQKQPYTELCSMNKDQAWLRLSGKVVFSNNLAVKEKVLMQSPLVKSIYKTADNPTFEVFYLEEVSASLGEIGKAPVFYK